MMAWRYSIIAALLAAGTLLVGRGWLVPSTSLTSHAPAPAPEAFNPPSVVPAPREPAATSTDWPIFRGDAGLRGLASAGTLDPPLQLRWTFKTGGAVKSSPIVVGQTLYIGSHDGKVYALHAHTGRKLWTFATDDQIEAPPLHVEGMIYIGSADGHLYALDSSSGQLRWRFAAQDKILGSANVLRDADGRARSIVFGSYDHHVYALHPADGSLQWSYVTDNFINGAPAIAGQRIVLGACDGKLHVLSADRGQLLMTVDLGGPIAGSPAVDGELACIGGYNNRFVAVRLSVSATPLRSSHESVIQASPLPAQAPPSDTDADAASTDHGPDDSALVWTYRDRNFPYFSSAAVTGDRVIFGGRDRRLHAVDQNTGERLWVFQARHKIDSSPVVVGNTVVVGSDDGRLYLLSLTDGSLLGSYTLGSAIVGSPAVVQGWVYVGADDGQVYAFESAK